MAKKTHTTRQKMTFRLAPVRPRNPLALPARLRSAGAHRKSTAAARAEAQRLLKKALEDDDD
jgi:hypothetical protein